MEARSLVTATWTAAVSAFPIDASKMYLYFT